MNSTGTAFEVSERYWAGRRRLLGILADLEVSDSCRETVYLTSDSLGAPEPGSGALEKNADLAGAILLVGQSDTGAVLFLWDDRTLAVVPPFPVDNDVYAIGGHPAGLVDMLTTERTVGIVLLRLGHYAVGVVSSDKLLGSKSGSRYVKRRHRAGGSSQRRFERSRERLAREFVESACEATRQVLAPFERRIDYLLMGGESHTLRGYVQRCPYVRRFAAVTLQRRLDVHRPGTKALKEVHYEVWKSRVLVLTREDRETTTEHTEDTEK